MTTTHLSPCPCESLAAELGAATAEHLLALAKTKADLQDLVRALHGRNLRLQAVRDALAAQLATARQHPAEARTTPEEARP